MTINLKYDPLHVKLKVVTSVLLSTVLGHYMSEPTQMMFPTCVQTAVVPLNIKHLETLHQRLERGTRKTDGFVGSSVTPNGAVDCGLFLATSCGLEF